MKSERKYQIKILRWGSVKKLEEDYGFLMWSDVTRCKGVRVSSVPFLFRNNIMKEMHNQYCENEWMRKFFYPLYLWGARLRKNASTVIIVNDSHPCLNNLEFFNYLKRKNKVTLVLCCINQIKNKKNPQIAGNSMESWKDIFDYIYTTDVEDAVRFQLHYVEGIFSKLKQQGSKNSSDVFYQGYDKGRSAFLSEIADVFKEKRIDYRFNLVSDSARSKQGRNIQYVPWTPYSDLLKNELESECILEIVESGQTSPTLRYLEAVVYNKKLLTNNSAVRDLYYYNPKYISVFSNKEDIDFNIIWNHSNVDYGYDGRYSPLKFIQEIMQMIKRDKKGEHR